MMQVDIILANGINEIIGPVGTLKRILKNQEYFNSRGYEVTVFTMDSLTLGPIKVPPAASKASLVGLKKQRRKVGVYLRMKAKHIRFLAKWFIEKQYEKKQQLLDYYLSLNRKPDVIQFHSNKECEFFLEKVKENRPKTVMFLHTDGIPFKMTLEYYPCLKESDYLKDMEEKLSWTVTNTDRICFIAKIGQKNFLQYYPNRSEADTTVILNGIDDLSAKQIEEISSIKKECEVSRFKYRLCCTGSINTRKGHRIIIEALLALPKDLQAQTHVDFMGDGPERMELQDYVKELGLEDNVTFYGVVPNVEVYKYLAKNNIFILMSKNEGLPISIIEAMRAGLPIISTNISGIPELINVGENGFLLNPDTTELTELLKKLPEYDWAKMGQNSRVRFENEFTFERMEKEFCDMYDILL